MWTPRFLLACALSTLVTTAQAAPAGYTVTDLSPTEVTAMRALDPTGTGAVVGTKALNGHMTAITLAPTMTTIGALSPNGSSRPNSTFNGTAVGYSGAGPMGDVTHAFRWTAAGGIEDLGTTGDAALFSAATHVSDGTILGYADDPDHTATDAVVWEPGQAIRILPTLGGKNGWAMGRNAVGDIVGYSSTVNNVTHATLWSGEATLDLHTLAGTTSFAMAVNDVQQVVGYGVFSGQTRAFVWTAFPGMITLAPLATHTASYAYGIALDGTVVGQSTKPGIPQLLRAVRWVNGAAQDLNTLVSAPGIVLENALGIDADGRIACSCKVGTQVHACLLTPTGEGM